MSVVALYDNPLTCCREAWQDGQLLARISWQLLEDKDYRGDRLLPFYVNDPKPFTPGELVHGDMAAIAANARPAAPPL